MKIPRNAMRQTIKLFACGFSLVPSPYATNLAVLCQLRQRHVAYRIDTVVILILWLVRHVPVLVLSPLVAPEIRQQADAPACHMDAVALQYIQTRYDAVLTLGDAVTHNP